MLQGASLISAGLQGADLSGAILEGASLEAKVWRAQGNPKFDLIEIVGYDANTPPWKDADTTSSESETTCAEWRDSILKYIPAERLREVRKNLSALDPAREPEDVIKIEFWEKAKSSSPRGKERGQRLASFLADLGCLGDSAPYVARGLINTANASTMPLEAFAARLRKGRSDQAACPGVKGFTDHDWAALNELESKSR